MRAHRILVGIAIAIACSTSAADNVLYEGYLSGASEVPVTSTSGNGSVLVSYDGVHALGVRLLFSGLSTNAIAAHIHCCAPAGTNVGVAVPMPAFPATMAAQYIQSFALDNTSTYASGFLSDYGTAAVAQATLLSAMQSGSAYFNIHTITFPGGEIRAILKPTLFHNGFD